MAISDYNIVMTFHFIQCEAPKIAKLVYNSNFTMVYGTYELVTGVDPENVLGIEWMYIYIYPINIYLW
jgi:hypothetical protein